LLSGGKVLVAGGSSFSNPVTDETRTGAEVFDPATEEFTPTQNRMLHTHTAHGAVLLTGSNCGNNCNKVLVFGGFDGSPAGPGSTSTTVAELYDPNTGWSLTGPMNPPGRFGEQGELVNLPGAVLPNGKVLVAGGEFCGSYSNCQISTQVAEIYDPVIGIWSLTEPMKRKRRLHAVITLADGSALAAGGDYRGGSDCRLLKCDTITAELYGAAFDRPVVTGISPPRGPVGGGTAVTVAGTGFAGASKVSFGSKDVVAYPCADGYAPSGAAPCFTQESFSKITVFSPSVAQPAKVNVTVTTPGGTSIGTPLDLFEYFIDGGPGPGGPGGGGPGGVKAPSVGGIDPNSGPTDGGTRVRVSGANLDKVTSVLFGEKSVSAVCGPAPGSGASPCFVPDSPGSLFVYSPAVGAPVKVHVTVQTPDGASPPTNADLFDYQSAPPPAVEKDPLGKNSLGKGLSGKPVGGGLSGTGSNLTPGLPGGAPGGAPATVQAVSPGPVQAPVAAQVSQPVAGSAPVPVPAPLQQGLPAVPGLSRSSEGSISAAPERGYNMTGRSGAGSPPPGLALSASGIIMLMAGCFIQAQRRSSRSGAESNFQPGHPRASPNIAC